MAEPKASQPKKTMEIKPGASTQAEAPSLVDASSLADVPAKAPGKKHDLSFLRPAEGKDELGRLGSYRILKVIGEGGMGLVLQAHDPALDRLLALKVMQVKQAENERSKQRFLLEAKAAAKIEHEHIVPIYQVGEDNGVPFIAMPYLQGETLAQRMRKQSPLPWQEAARIAREMLEGLSAAHAKGLVHRDIKPANIWLDTPAPRKPSRARILDFGLARNQNEDTHITQAGSILGTPAYMSPEQAKAEEVDLRTDLFSVGSILYQMCTGKTPFPGANTFAIISALANTQPKPVREVNPNVPEGIVQIIGKLLEKDRNRRPKNAETVAQAISAVEKNPAMSFVKNTGVVAGAPPSATPGASGSNNFAFTATAPNAATGEAPLIDAGSSGVLRKGKTKTQAAAKRGVPLWMFLAGGGGIALILIVTIVAVLMSRGGPDPAPSDKGGGVALVDKGGAPPVIPPVIPPVQPPVVPPDRPPVDPQPPVVPPVMPPVFPQNFKPLEVQVKPLTPNSVGMTLVQIDPGVFRMGSPEGESKSIAEMQHEVELSKRFHIAKLEVNVGQFRQFVDATRYQTEAEKAGSAHGYSVALKKTTIGNYSWKNPGMPQADDHPVVCVTWNDAQAYCKWLSAKEGKIYTLPTEAEWEYCCRAGTTTAYFFGPDSTHLERYAHIGGGGTQPGGSLLPNAWGLFDMAGSVYEWCEDGYDINFYKASPFKDPIGPANGALRVYRGGYFKSTPISIRSSARVGKENGYASAAVGFRVVLRSEPLPNVAPPVTPMPMDPPPAIVKEQPKRPEITNKIGMTLVAIEPGKFTMGSPPSETGRSSYEPEREVELSKGFYIGKFEVTVGEFKKFVADTGFQARGGVRLSANFTASSSPTYSWTDPGYPQTDDHPVAMISWDTAKAFCKWLSDKEGKTYALPTIAEWEYCCRAGTQTSHYGGSTEASLLGYVNGADQSLSGRPGISPSRPLLPFNDRYLTTSPVGAFKSNAWGLHDMLGNLMEWCEDNYAPNTPFLGGKDPQGPMTGPGRILRGGSFYSPTIYLRSASNSVFPPPTIATYEFGFRVVLREEPNKVAAIKPPEPPPTDVDLKAEINVKTTAKELTNSLGMKLLRVEPGKFEMGSLDNEQGRTPSETRHDVDITKAFYMGKFEVTQDEYQKLMGKNPSYFAAVGGGKKDVEGVATKQFPVDSVSWKIARDFCKQLTDKERESGKIGKELEYTLPTEAEWEYVCRAGTTTPFSFGATVNTDQANYSGDTIYGAGQKGAVRKKPVPVGMLGVNAWGFADMHGNVAEWCEDGYETDFYVKPLAKTDPVAAVKTGDKVVSRGGSFFSNVNYSRSASRSAVAQGSTSSSQGFRVVLRLSPKPSPTPDADLLDKKPKDFANSLGMKLVWIEPGKFSMGSPISEISRNQGEGQHDVEISKGFYMAKFEVTQEEYTKVMGSNPSQYSPNGKHKLDLDNADTRKWPVDSVSWTAAKQFCQMLTDKEKREGKLKAGMVYTLPTEAEWEYACRAGTTTMFHSGNNLFNAQANIRTNNFHKPMPVGSYAPNAWGLCDMHGNAEEWCEDGYDRDYYSRSPKKDPIGEPSSQQRVVRGGAHSWSSNMCRSAHRSGRSGTQTYDNIGFRIVLRVPTPKTP